LMARPGSCSRAGDHIAGHMDAWPMKVKEAAHPRAARYEAPSFLGPMGEITPLVASRVATRFGRGDDG